ncbi:MAG: hypothetical protein LUO89_11285 [Methanothrix sp.]|nr:hypothetical protein [Methanothrix sp.]
MTTYLTFLTYPVVNAPDETDTYLVQADSMEEAGEKIVAHTKVDPEKVPVTLYALDELEPIVQI